MIPEDVIRQRSYEIWEREGCPAGKDLEHWLRARRELEAEFRRPMFGKSALHDYVAPRPHMSRPPQRRISARIGTSAGGSDPAGAAP